MTVALEFLTQGGQPLEVTLSRLVAFIDGAHETIDLAIYDAHLPGPPGEALLVALDRAEKRGVTVRAVYNEEWSGDDAPPRSPASPPPGGPSLMELLAQAVPSKPVNGLPDLMHHKYVVRDRRHVWTGSANWTADAWTLQENVLVEIDSPPLAHAYTVNFEDLWRHADVERSGGADDDFDQVPFDGTTLNVRALFSPGRGSEISELIGEHLRRAARVRICSPVLTAPPILNALADVAPNHRDLRITVDAPMMRQARRQWSENGRSGWKVEKWDAVWASGRVAAKPSTPYAPGRVHDYMHAKLVVCDDVTFTGSYNCSRSGERNAENVLILLGSTFADRCAVFAESVHTRYAATK